MIAGERPTETKNATDPEIKTLSNAETLLDLALTLANPYANFRMPNDPALRHCMARYDSPTKRPAEESKKRRKMAAKSRKENRKR
jgi:hypothetical protein